MSRRNFSFFWMTGRYQSATASTAATMSSRMMSRDSRSHIPKSTFIGEDINTYPTADQANLSAARPGESDPGLPERRHFSTWNRAGTAIT